MWPACLAVCVLQVLKKICWYAVLAPSYSTEEGSSSDVSTLIATTAAYKQLGDLPLHKQLLTTFTNPEIVRWGLFEAQYGAEITAEVRQPRCTRFSGGGWWCCYACRTLSSRTMCRWACTSGCSCLLMAQLSVTMWTGC